jgi:hypothetical protein
VLAELLDRRLARRSPIALMSTDILGGQTVLLAGRLRLRGTSGIRQFRAAWEKAGLVL